MITIGPIVILSRVVDYEKVFDTVRNNAIFNALVP